ncbi:MAG: response regulator transcription factor [Planctomycetales bacterium]|nr:response regulator transcription factor [Planctomycetales bacterium]
MIQQGNYRHTNDALSETGGGAPPVRLTMILANTVDCDAMSALFSQSGRIDVVEASTDIDFSLTRCQRLFPQVILVDPKVAFDSPRRVAEVVRLGHARHGIVLDDRLHEGRLAEVLPMNSISYLTRQAGLTAIVVAIVQGATHGKRTFDPAFASRVLRTPRGWRLEQAHGRPSVAALTSRELEVMRHLARGRTVRDCAKILKLAESTIDNHKARLMKKLEIHKAAELTHVAIRDGVISI